MVLRGRFKPVSACQWKPPVQRPESGQWLGRVVKTAVLAAALVVGSMGIAGVGHAKETAAQSTSLAMVALAQLPAEARQTHQRILDGGPFPYPKKDGIVFGNRERLLPREYRGYYREYTVPTPQARDRGARRIVCGGNQPKTPEVCYYTQDHYASFRRIAH